METLQPTSLQLKPEDPIPGVRVQSAEDWVLIQLRLRQGETLTPLLPLGADAGFVWIPKNGCSSLKRAWLQLEGVAPDEIHSEIHASVLTSNHWLRPDQLSALAQHRNMVAIWRDPIDRYVSDCRSHSIEFTNGRIHAKLQANSQGNSQAYEQALTFHQQLLPSKRCAALTTTLIL